VDSVRRVTDIMGEITVASKEQTDGIEQVNQAVNQMDEGTQQNAALVEQAAAAADSLQEQAVHLAHVVSVFKLDGIQLAGSAPAASFSASVIPLTPKAAPRAARKPVASVPAASQKRIANTRPADQTDWEEF